MPLEGARPRDTSISDWESGLRTGRGHISVVFIEKSVVLCHSSPRTRTQQGHQKGVPAPEKNACKGPEARSLGGGTEPRGESGQRALPLDRVWPRAGVHVRSLLAPGTWSCPRMAWPLPDGRRPAVTTCPHGRSWRQASQEPTAWRAGRGPGKPTAGPGRAEGPAGKGRCLGLTAGRWGTASPAGREASPTPKQPKRTAAGTGVRRKARGSPRVSEVVCSPALTPRPRQTAGRLPTNHGD